MGDMDEWDCFKCGAYCSYRPSNLCRTCEDQRLLFQNSLRLWFDENQIPWAEHDETFWKVRGEHGPRFVDLGNGIRKVLNSQATLKDGDVLVWKKIPGPLDSPSRSIGPDDDYIPKIVADLNYHEPEFFTKLEEAINGK